VTSAAAIARGEAKATRLTKHLVQDLAMCCGGSMELWIEPLDASRWKALAEAARRRARRLGCALVTALDEPGGKDVRDPVEHASLDGARFVEPILPAERLVLFGGGHVARALAPIAASVGYELVVCDEEEAWASDERFPGAQLLHSFDPAEVARELAPFGGRDHVVILTRDHAVDQKILEGLVGIAGQLDYLGLIGSRGKLERFRKRLEAKGMTMPPALHSPVGLDIGAETPEEIAVAIVAELVQVRRKRAPS
jgi:xanthine dehydrogenase accessory factor